MSISKDVANIDVILRYLKSGSMALDQLIRVAGCGDVLFLSLSALD